MLEKSLRTEAFLKSSKCDHSIFSFWFVFSIPTQLQDLRGDITAADAAAEGTVMIPDGLRDPGGGCRNPPATSVWELQKCNE